MKTIIVYDSYFGNTEQVAREVGKALAETEVFRVGKIRPEQLIGVERLIVGSPTRAFKATKAIYRFLDEIPYGGLQGVMVASFDTRISTADVN
ncbi:MAG: flavodoxin family protein [Bacillota bacterium]|nr:flavodoxin family protein [Bacillota bacterium]MDW7682637.1 flavodoxin family protein [Bacillota bacterium]